jgi:aminoglycoside phosphotransferase (APT) family kinase protein
MPGDAHDPNDPADVAAALPALLAPVLGAPPRLAEPPTAATGGLATFVWYVRLAPPAPPGWDRPLVLRVYRHGVALQRVEHEAAVMRAAAAGGFPAPQVLAVGDAASGGFGAPWMVMTRVAGRLLFDGVRTRPWRAAALLERLADLHAHLHALAVDDLAEQDLPPLAEERLARVAEFHERAGTPATLAGIGWLRDHRRDVDGGDVAICHNDFHPLNVLVDAREALWVIDWTDAGVGDPHCDVARSLALFWAAPIAATSAAERAALRAAGGWMARRYRRAYGKRRALDPRRLRWWEAVHTLDAELRIRALHAGRAEGWRDDAAGRVPARLAGVLHRRFEALVHP